MNIIVKLLWNFAGRPGKLATAKGIQGGQCRQCIQFRQCRLQSQELRKTCIISCENWSAAKQSHLLDHGLCLSHSSFWPFCFLSSNTSWIVLEWGWKVFWNPNVPFGGDVIFWRALQGAWLGSHGCLETTLSILKPFSYAKDGKLLTILYALIRAFRLVGYHDNLWCSFSNFLHSCDSNFRRNFSEPLT